MQLPINLATFVRGFSSCTSTDKRDFFIEYEKALSKRDSKLGYKEEEANSLAAFVGACFNHGLDETELDGFAYSYSIPHISKEIDLLKICEDRVLIIELKSRLVGNDNIKDQLVKDWYYLSFLEKEIICLTYCSADDIWFELNGDILQNIGWMEAAKHLHDTAQCVWREDLDTLFTPSNYLISPIMSSEAFLSGCYFLTDQQAMLKKGILKYLAEEGSGGHVVMGEAGTGKTLLLYDVALTIAKRSSKQALIIHGARLSDAHRAFNNVCREIEVVGPKRLATVDVTQYCIVGFDEAHRMYPDQFENAIERANGADVPYLVMLDSKQEMSKIEQASDIEAIAKRLVPEERHVAILSKKLRTNASVANYIEALINGEPRKLDKTDRIILEYAPTNADARRLVNYYWKRGYVYIPVTPSMYSSSELDYFQPAGFPNTHDVIGLEFDSVVMVVTDRVFFDGEKLSDGYHPNPNLLPTKLLYQGLTRARERIAVIFRCDWKVFQYAVELLA